MDDKTPLDPSIPLLAHQAACARASLRIIIRPRLTTFDVGVHAISTIQVDLLCPAAIEAGTTIAIRWDYGPPRCWRTIRATAADTAKAADGRSVVTCVFGEPLQPADVEALLIGDHRPAWTQE